MIWALPSVFSDVIEVTPAMVENWRSSGAATEIAMVSGLAPGYVTVTEIIRGAMDHGEELKAEVIRVLAMVWFAALFVRVRGWEDPGQMGDDLENAVRLLLPGSDGSG